MAPNLVPTFCPEARAPLFFTLASFLSQLLQAPVGKCPTKQPGKDQMAVNSYPPQSAEQMRVGHVPEPRGEEAPDKAHPSHTPASSAPSLLLDLGHGGLTELSPGKGFHLSLSTGKGKCNYDHSQHQFEKE